MTTPPRPPKECSNCGCREETHPIPECKKFVARPPEGKFQEHQCNPSVRYCPVCNKGPEGKPDLTVLAEDVATEWMRRYELFPKNPHKAGSMNIELTDEKDKAFDAEAMKMLTNLNPTSGGGAFGATLMLLDHMKWRFSRPHRHTDDSSCCPPCCHCTPSRRGR